MLAGDFPFGGHDRGAGQDVSGPDLFREADLEPADRLRSEPVLHDPGREPHRKHAVPEHRRIADLGGDGVVVMHGVEVAGRAGVPDEHRAGQRRELLGALVADLHGRVRHVSRAHTALLGRSPDIGVRA
jgi:hypothetical protein